MTSKLLSSGLRALNSASLARQTARGFQTSARRLEAGAAAPLPARRPVGAFRGGLYGFAIGSLLAGGGVYSYVLQEYKASNDLLTEDIYALQASVQRLTTYVQALEDKVDAAERKRK